MEAKNKSSAATSLSEEQKNTKLWLEDLEQEQDRISQYEKDSVADMQHSFEIYGRLTDRRYEKLQRLHDKYF